MNTPYYLISEAAEKRNRRMQSLIAAMLGAILAGLTFIALADDVQELIDLRMELACSWPKQNGEMTVITIEDGKFKCWVWR